MLLGIHSREKKTSVHIKACTQLFIEASSDLVRLCGLKKKKNKKTQLLMVLWLCIQLVFTHIFCLCLQEIWDYKARRASTGKAE